MRDGNIAAQRDVLATIIERVVPVQVGRGRHVVEIEWTPLGRTLQIAQEQGTPRIATQAAWAKPVTAARTAARPAIFRPSGTNPGGTAASGSIQEIEDTLGPCVSSACEWGKPHRLASICPSCYHRL
jgi:hypothetical protein